MKSKTQVHHVNGDATSDSGSGRSPSPPPLPPRRSTCRRRLRSKAQLQSNLQESFAASILVRRNLRYLFVLALLYVAGLVMCEGPFSKLMGQPAPLSSVYRSQEVFVSLWQDMESDNSSSIELSSLWKYKRKLKEQKTCVNLTSLRYLDVDGGMMPKPSNYLIVEAGGGLNQQRSVICNAVAVAGILNAILVIPHFQFHKVWRDSSKFGDIYDEDHFIATLKYHVKVVKELPEALMEKYNYDITNVTRVHVEAWAPVSYYIREVYPVLQRQRVIRLSPFANRLAMNVPPNIQFLRCLTNFEALRFSHQISTLAQKLVNRMTEKSSLTNGKYVSVHLRFKEDMAAFSCCAYDRGEVGKFEMDSVREKGWKGKLKQKARIIEPSLNRVDGKCPWTPVEVGLVLRGMGFRNTTPIYLASGKIYREERYLSPLLKMFPNLHTKDSLATADELAPFKGYSSRLAALDYMLCLFSEAFVATQGGNFPHFLMGHRRFLYGGHAKTIMPDKQKLVVMLQDVSISWKAFKDQMELMLQENDWKGIMVPRVRKINRKTSIYKYPLPECRCLQQSHASETDQNVGIPNWYLMTRI